MKIPREKITENQRNHLLQVYLHMGSAPARELAIQYGVSPNYAHSYASALGLQPTRKFNGGGRVYRSTKINHADPRWERARAVGAVIA